MSQPASRSSVRPRARSLLLALVLVLPLIIGAAVAAVADLDPARTWSAGDEASGAPAVASPAGIDPAELVDARRAAGEAATQAGFLTTGTGELVDGTGQMREEAAVIPEQFDEAVTGAQQLADGLVQLQAGTGRLGSGATEVADGVGQAVDQVVGLGALQGQLVEAINRTVRDLEGSDDPRLTEARQQLIDLRGQVETIQLNGPVADQLTALKDGAREIANQLNVPGYAFHDGIYSATKGAQDLAYGLSQSQGGIDEAIAGVESLDDGAQRLDQMATRTDEKVDAVQRALPVVQATPQATADGQALEDEPARALTPLYAMFIAALVMLGGAALGVAARLASGRRVVILAAGTLGLTALGVVCLALVATGLTVATGALAAVVLALGVLASAVLTRVTIAVLGAVVGGVLAAVGGIAQVGLVGWVWKSAAAADIAVVWQVLANLLPLNWATSALTALGNGGSGQALWLAVGVLAAIAVIGLAAGRMVFPAAAASVTMPAVTGSEPAEGEGHGPVGDTAVYAGLGEAGHSR
ncbi:ABC transporter permease [Corynebacterium halotolerans]|uniref:X-X-X-Leu-X-X-Gly heptad repeat-containing protein n=1 Tax=Corynebacterium halotolerans YIM 70093 = DSM 44683 TaxID=1121362 RepID=M1MUC1_9CORY|nr:ABC transporter permease [Corynebacterium halotolerans]AGF71334.1 hypothetical protein A605_01600 [Corynebacterium halotolerans YIM 70093 = DSM 44683]